MSSSAILSEPELKEMYPLGKDFRLAQYEFSFFLTQISGRKSEESYKRLIESNASARKVGE